uniref:Os01g0778700 protein n=1 Tax=Macrostomum lignano TaxID=282301 RepID=A0A1I8FFZ8_9PLAT
STKIRAVSLAAGGSWTCFIIGLLESAASLLAPGSASRRNRPNYPALDESAIRSPDPPAHGTVRCTARKPGPYTRIRSNRPSPPSFKRSCRRSHQRANTPPRVVAEREPSSLRTATSTAGACPGCAQMKLRLKEELANRLAAAAGDALEHGRGCER